VSLAGKRAVVTGGGSGVGLATAVALAAEGATVWIAGRRDGPLAAAAAAQPGLRTAVADVTDEASVAALFRTTGPVDIVVANAGEGRSSAFRRQTLAEWQAMLTVNLTGTFLTFREGLAAMPRGGRLIAIASILSLRGDPYVAAYAAAKHGVLGLVRSVAKEVAREEITVNAVCPGYVDTPMTDRTVAGIAARTGRTEAEARAFLAGTNPMGRLVRPEEVASAVLWLASDGAGMVTGQAITLSGGEP
jgi:NAD(P)-dependent dehydrogenase (short-subunit alcohol dehydrogenase family)